MPDINSIKEYYNNNKDKFMSNEFRSAETLLLDAKEYAKKLTVTKDEIELLFDEKKELLIQPAERYLNQIIVDSK